MKGTDAMQMLSRSLTKASSRKALVAVVIALIVCSNLAFTGRMAKNRTRVQPQPEKEQFVKKVDDRLIAATSKFAFKLYGQVLKERSSKNVFVSPASVLLALAMTYNGAEGDTRPAMADALEVEGMSLEELNRASADLKSSLGSADPKVQLKIANSLWVKNGFSPKPQFIERNKEYYAAEVASLDFASPAAPATINSWVRGNTEGKIDRVVDRITPETILFLINAIYFKGQWQVEFEKEKTEDDVFRLADGRQKKLPMMVQSGKYNYHKGKEVKHKTFAEVNEEGTVAAAVTSVGIGLTSVQRPQEKFIMKVDRPFFFAIRDNGTGVVLFMGSVADPG